MILLGNAVSGSKQQHVSLKMVLLLCLYEHFDSRKSVEFTIQHGVEMAWCNSVELALIYLTFQQSMQTEK